MTDDESELLDLIYEAAVIPELWPTVLTKIAGLSGCYGGTLFSMDARREIRQVVTEEYREVMEIFVRDGWTKQNVRAERLLELKYPGFVTDVDVMTIDEMDHHPFYTELLRPNGGGWAIGTIITIPTGDFLVFNLERRYAKGPVEKALCARLDPLRPHLARSGLLSERLRMERARAMVDAIEQIGLPAAILRQNGQALAVNASLQSLGDQIKIGAFNNVTFVNRSSDVLLKTTLDSVLHVGNWSGVKSIPIPATASSPALIAHLMPIKGAAHDVFSRASMILVITPLAAPMAPSEDVLNGLFDLSPAEVRVAQGIVSGKTIDAVALDFNLSRETVRNQLKAVFAKTGTGRQAELVGLLASTVFPNNRDIRPTSPFGS